MTVKFAKRYLALREREKPYHRSLKTGSTLDCARVCPRWPFGQMCPLPMNEEVVQSCPAWSLERNDACASIQLRTAFVPDQGESPPHVIRAERAQIIGVTLTGISQRLVINLTSVVTYWLTFHIRTLMRSTYPEEYIQKWWNSCTEIGTTHYWIN